MSRFFTTTALPNRSLYLVSALIVAGGVGSLRHVHGAEAKPTADLQVDVRGLTSQQGRLMVGLFRDEASWLDWSRATQILRLAPRPPRTVATFAGVPEGHYALAVFHDQNGNGKMDFRYFPIPGPAEPGGVSNNPRSRFGPPSFAQARFEHPSPAGVHIIELLR